MPEKFISPIEIILMLAVCYFWFVVELWELGRFHYEIKPLKTRILLYMVRILPFIFLFLVMPKSMNFLMPMAIIVATFYIALYFDRRLALIMLILFLVIQLTADLTLVDPFRPKRAEEGTDLLFILYKVMNTILLWMITVFWKEDRKQWYHINGLNNQLTQTQKRLKSYADKVADMVILEERTRLARDMHDSLGHNLTAATVQLNKAEAYLDRNPQIAREALKEVHSCLQEGMRDVREVLSGTTEDSGRFKLFEETKKITKRIPLEEIRIENRFEGEETRFNKAVLLTVYRLVQEGITNALKHAEASLIRIEILLGDKEAKVVVADNGKGFSLNTSNSGLIEAVKVGGTGLKGLCNRVEVVLGVLKIESALGKGTRLEAIIPREPADLVEEGNSDEF